MCEMYPGNPPTLGVINLWTSLYKNAPMLEIYGTHSALDLHGVHLKTTVEYLLRTLFSKLFFASWKKKKQLSPYLLNCAKWYGIDHLYYNQMRQYNIIICNTNDIFEKVGTHFFFLITLYGQNNTCLYVCNQRMLIRYTFKTNFCFILGDTLNDVQFHWCWLPGNHTVIKAFSDLEFSIITKYA